MSNLQASLNRLNDKQKEAVLTTRGPVLIAAGAGSGKTSVLTTRIAYLIEEQQVNPWNILAITFTNKAANEMKERVNSLVGEKASDIWISTFHSMCARILRREGSVLGYTSNFTIVDDSEQRSLIKTILKEMNLSTKVYNDRQILSIIDEAKNDGISAKEYAENAEEDNLPNAETYAEIYKKYQARLKASNAMDFNDLLFLTVKLFKENPEILRFYQNKFQYIHVDEYQDTNEIQYRLVNLLAGILKNICVVGDSDQAIYGWRGANIENMLNFEKDYPEAKIILLEQNYRSTQTILNAANSVIENNTQRQAKKLWSDKEEGSKVHFRQEYSDIYEADYIVNKIKELKISEQAKASDFAVLYRTQAQSRRLEEAFMKEGVPFRLVGGVRFYARKEIQDTIAYLNVLANPNDTISLSRIINVPKRGLGDVTVGRLEEHANNKGIGWLEAISDLEGSGISASASKKLVEFSSLINDLRQETEDLTVTETVELVWGKTGYRDALINENTPEAKARLENLDELLTVTKEFDEAGVVSLIVDEDPDFLEQDENSQVEDEYSALSAFLTGISLATDLDQVEENDCVTLMTLHAAKGLEFDYVFISGLEEGIFPLWRAIQEGDVEEERRLAYVGMTRARKRLFLTCARSRMLYGQTQNNRVSRFVNEIDSNYLEGYNEGDTFDNVVEYDFVNQNRVTPKKPKPKRKAKAKKKSLDEIITDWEPGEKAYHKTWGVGTVVSVKGEGKDMIVTVAYPEVGIKQLIAEFAPITRVDKE